MWILACINLVEYQRLLLANFNFERFNYPEAACFRISAEHCQGAELGQMFSSHLSHTVSDGRQHILATSWLNSIFSLILIPREVLVVLLLPSLLLYQKEEYINDSRNPE